MMVGRKLVEIFRSHRVFKPIESDPFIDDKSIFLSSDEPDAVRDYFERTPPMSTYTLGLVIAQLQLLDNYTKHRSLGGKHICEDSTIIKIAYLHTSFFVT